MKAVIPAAGIGKRLRPHTLNKPKALLPVAGRPILGHIIDDLVEAGLDEFVIIVGYMQDAVRDWFARRRPEAKVTFVEQPRRLGLGHAIWTARDCIGGDPFFCILGDTILKVDYADLLSGGGNLIAVREVADPSRYGVVETDAGRVTRFVEKPDQPRTNLAIVGAYLFHEGGLLLRALDRIVTGGVRTKGEFQLTDALELMVKEGCHFATVPVQDWFDCGEPRTWLQTNRVLLDREGPGTPDDRFEAPCAVAPDVTLERTAIGPYVSIGPGCTLCDCQVTDCVVGANSRLTNCRLSASLVGDHCTVTGVTGEVNVGDYSELNLQAG